MKYIVLLSLLFFVQSTYSQIGKDEYLTAKSYFDAGDYTNCLAQLSKVESLLGESNGVIEHLRVKCYFNLGKMTESKNALIEFCKYPSSDIISSEMKQYEKKLKLAELAEPLKRLKEQELEIEKLFDSRVSYINQKISDKEVEIKQFIKYGTGEYHLAMKDGSIESLEKFLVDFPNSIHVDSVRNRLIPLLKEQLAKEAYTTSFTTTETKAYYPGGSSAYKTFLVSNFVYPEAALSKNIQGKVFIEFTINKDGVITEPKVVRGIGGGCDEAALDLVKKMPNWIPATQRGVPVKTKYVLRISFVLK